MPQAIKGLCLVGATGSIGESTLKVAREQGIPITALFTRKSHQKLMFLAKEHCVKTIGLLDEKSGLKLKKNLPKGITLLLGEKEILGHIQTGPHSHVMMALVGNAGILPALAAAEGGKVLLLANKESLVSAGDLLAPFVSLKKGNLRPVDSEHGAIWQCLAGEKLQDVANLWLTASGGPFLKWPLKKIQNATVENALNHPTWKMGPKITVDSASLMNKGLEVIEAQRLFGLPYDQIKVVIHPQSIVHSLVEFKEGSYKAQMGAPDMTVPILYALFGPRHLPSQVPPNLPPTSWPTLSFSPPDQRKFPCLGLAYAAGREGGTAPCVLNAANEEAVEGFLAGKIKFLQIAQIVDRVLQAHHTQAVSSAPQLLEQDVWARRKAKEVIQLVQ